MGKVKRLRQKYHASLKQGEQDSQKTNTVLDSQHVMPVIDKAVSLTPQSDNMFAGLQINLKAIEPTQESPVDESDKMSLASTTMSMKGITKKEKIKQRRESLLKKIDVVRTAEREDKERKKRKSTAIVGDVHPMLNALEDFLAQSKNSKQPLTKKTKSTKKQKQATKDMLADIDMFVAVNRDSQFTKDPFKAASVAVQNRVLYEDENKSKEK